MNKTEYQKSDAFCNKVKALIEADNGPDCRLERSNSQISEIGHKVSNLIMN